MELPLGYLEALSCMRKASHPNGFLASAAAGENYPRIWARDGVITGLAALASREETLIETFRRTLQRLGEFQSPEGHIPSNVATDRADVSLGGLAGRADTGSWWIIGLCLYAHWTGDRAFLLAQRERIARIFNLYQAWEYNNRNLLYVPLAGDWADEYLLHGYTLYDQVLRCAALKLAGKALQDEGYSEKGSRIQQAIEKNYWLASNPDASCIHPTARERLLAEKGPLPYLLAGFHPAGYQPYLDLFGNALAMLFDIHPSPAHTLEAVTKLAPMLPVFSPVVDENAADFALLRQNYRYTFRNKPHEFHNGGIWPMVLGFYGLATQKHLSQEAAKEVYARLDRLNAQENYSFNECFHGLSELPCGVPACTWSAAGQVLLYQGITNGFSLSA